MITPRIMSFAFIINVEFTITHKVNICKFYKLYYIQKVLHKSQISKIGIRYQAETLNTEL